jgi:hypothetical protein
MVLLALPTFYMPTAYLALAGFVLWNMFVAEARELPAVVKPFIEPALTVTLVLWPFYIAWVGLCRRLSWKEKALWWFLVVFLNMFGMPMFYVFVTRRYLGIDQCTSARDERAAASLLSSCGLARSAITTQQWQVLVRYCRHMRWLRWSLGPVVVVSALGLYFACWFLPHQCFRMFPDMIPRETVLIDRAGGASQTIAPEPQQAEQFVQLVFVMGASAGMVGAMALFGMVQCIAQIWTDLHRRAFLEFLRAGNPERPPSAVSTPFQG